MKNTTVIGYKVLTATGVINVYGDACGPGTATYENPEPCSIAEAYNRVSKYLNKPGDIVPTVVPVTRELTPLETASQELGGMLSDLCKRHGLNLGLSQAQIERQIAKELAELGAKAR